MIFAGARWGRSGGNAVEGGALRCVGAQPASLEKMCMNATFGKHL